MKEVELLAPAGNFGALISAVQNGADAVYFGSEKFNARVGSQNFDLEELKEAIKYAKLRNVKTHLTLNILIKNNEFAEALELVEYAYSSGIDAVIVQDLGLAKKIIELYPKLEVHASTQMTTYDKAGVRKLEELGFNRAVLARELSIEEISKVCKNSKIDIEVFIHGALCISYSGQCLMSSMIGGRSGNRGKCAGTCRLPYELINKDNNKIEEKGYLLSSKDVCSLDIIPELIEAGVKSFKIEGRMKSPEYVGVVTSIYRKYIDLAQSNKPYVVDENDKEKLLQVFNRGGFSTGYLKGKLGKDMMYTKRPNHLGILVGEVFSYNPNKGYVKFKAEKELSLGDSIAINNESCKISELMIERNNIKIANSGQIITIGRIKGNIKPKDKIYKTVSIKLLNEVNQKTSKENRKRKIKCKLIAKQNEDLILEVEDLVTNIKIQVLGQKLEKAESKATLKERIEEQLQKTGGTVFEIEKLIIEADENVFIPIKTINELRREALNNLQEEILKTIPREHKGNICNQDIGIKKDIEQIKVNVLLNKINSNYCYKDLRNIDNIYIHISQFFISENTMKIDEIIKNFNTYIYFPAIIKEPYRKIIERKIEELVSQGIKGFVLSNISQVELTSKYDLEKIANYTFNIFNNETIKEIKSLVSPNITISPELNKEEIKALSNAVNKELIVYGRTLLMTSEYCPIGTFHNCKGKCREGKYEFRDRMGVRFPVYADRINCNTMIYNSKITSILWNDLNVDSIRLDMLDETIDEINSIVQIHRNGNRLEGEEYTNGNLNKNI